MNNKSAATKPQFSPPTSYRDKTKSVGLQTSVAGASFCEDHHLKYFSIYILLHLLLK